LTLVSERTNLGLKKIKKYKKFFQGVLKKKFLNIAPKNIIFEVFEVDRGSS
jgi:uncharacterized membrane protein